MPAPASISHPGVFPDFARFSSYLEQLGMFRMRPGLDRVQSVLFRLGLERPPFTVVQVAGTNGKGSTCTMLESLSRAHGLRTGLHTSPHFLSVRERIRCNGAMLPEQEWTGIANTLMASGGETLSYFEFVTCLAVLAFARATVDIAIMETGLGGRFDATTAVEADMVVFTPFGLDHQTILGPTLKDIAADKADCIRPGRPVISAVQQPEAAREIAARAAERSAPLQFVDDAFPLPSPDSGTCIPLRLSGAFQRQNARLALSAWRCLRENAVFSHKAARSIQNRLSEASQETLESQGLARAWLPGRMQFIPPLPAHAADGFFPCSFGWPPILLDGAHNGHGLASLGLALAKAGIAPSAVIFSCLADKDLTQILPHLRTLATGPVFVPPIKGNPRAAEPAALAANIGLNARPVNSLEEALQKASAHMADRLPQAFTGEAPKNPLLICGSLYLLAEFLAFRPECLKKEPLLAEKEYAF